MKPGTMSSPVVESIEPRVHGQALIRRAFGELRFHTDGEVLALAFAPGNTLWSVEEPGLLRRWNGLTGQQLGVTFLSDVESAWKFSPDAHWLASASDNLSLWEVASGRLQSTLSQPSWVTAIAFSSDSKRLTTGHDDGTVRIWDRGSGNLLREFQGHRATISSVALSPDGQQLAAASEDRVIVVWDVATGSQRGSLKGHTDRIQEIVWHPGGAPRVFSAGWDTTARVWDTNTFEPVILLNDHADQVTALAFSPDGAVLACADSASVVHLWDPEEGTSLGVLKDHDGNIRALAFSADGRYLASAGEGRAIHLWDPNQKRQLSGRGTPSLHRSSLALTRDGNRLVSNCGGASLQVWDTASGRVAVEVESTDVPEVLALSPNNRWIAGEDSANSIQIWDATTGKGDAVLQGQKGRVTALAFSPDSKLLASASGSDGMAWLWDLERRTTVLIIPEAAENCLIEAIAFHPAGKLLAVGGIDWLATGGSDGATCLWDIEQRSQLVALDGGIIDLAFHPAGRLLATVSLQDSIFIWDIEIQEVALELPCSGDGLTRVAYSADGKWLASGGDSGMIRIWRADNGTPAGAYHFETQIKGLCFSPDGRELYTTNGNTTSFQVDLAKLIGQSR